MVDSCFQQHSLALLQIIFTVLIDALSTVGKNGQQILSAVLKQIKLNAKLLTSFTTSGRVESSLINHVQVFTMLLLMPCCRLLHVPYVAFPYHDGLILQDKFRETVPNHQDCL